MSSEKPKMSAQANRLIKETSPYLRQHAHNPVDWYPWGEEAFARARSEGKPIFLSVGYSTCHWCHVMARESFENPAIAELMNRHFVNIKVDREERPDVDRVHMTYVQSVTGRGGWPMSVWLTPDLVPFYGGTYFPPTDGYGQPGFPALLQALASAWEQDRDRVLLQGSETLAALTRYANERPQGTPGMDASVIARAVDWYGESFDEANGGFGGAPKFPRPVNLDFLFRAGHWTGLPKEQRSEATRMALLSLDKMAEGGVRDHLGGGFHRYAVDERWRVPHFEKMLYDQAQLACCYADAAVISGDGKFREILSEIIDYVVRDLSAPAGGYASAEDADSGLPGEPDSHAEGAFYLWTKQEIESILDADTARLFCRRYGVEENGNAPAGTDPHGEFRGRNILFGRLTTEACAEESGLSEEAALRQLAEARNRLFTQRCERPRPARDDKVVTAWNGLMLSAFCRAYQVNGRSEDLVRGQELARFLRGTLYDSASGRLWRSFCAGKVSSHGFAEDYAFLIQGLLDLYESDFDVRWLEWADSLQSAQDELFGDEKAGGYFVAEAADESLLIRLKEDYDGAEPSPNSVAVLNLLRLGRLLGNSDRIDRAEKTLSAFSGVWAATPQALPLMLGALLSAIAEPAQIVLAGKPESAAFSGLAGEVYKRYLPGVTLAGVDGGRGQDWLAQREALYASFAASGSGATAYLCRDFACETPVSGVDEFRRLLARQESSPEA